MYDKLKARKRQIQKEIQEARTEYFNKKIKECGKDSKKQWKVLNEMMETKDKKGKSNTIEELEINGEVFKGEEKCANQINDFFINITDGNNVNEKEALKNVKINEKSIFMKPATLEEIEEIMETMPKNKPPGEDGITMELLLKSKQKIAPILTKIANRCIETGKFPKTLKTAIITPIYKKGGKKNAKN